MQTTLDGQKVKDMSRTNFKCDLCGSDVWKRGDVLKCGGCGHVERPQRLCRTCQGWGDLQFLKPGHIWKRDPCPDCMASGRMMNNGLIVPKE